jgi:multidrug efflux system membrane fusion protein
VLPRNENVHLTTESANLLPDPSPDGPPAPRWTIATAVLALGTLGFVLLSREPARPKLPPARPQAVRTRVLAVHPREFQVALRAQGVVRAREEITLSAQVSGRVARVSERFEDGSFFAANEVLLELEDEDYRTAVAMAVARLRSAEAARQLALLSHRRNEGLLKDRLLPEAQAEVTEATLAQAQADVNSAAAQLERARRDHERTRVRAPFNGCVRRRAVGPGQLVGPSTVLGSIFSVDEAEVRLPVAVRDLRFMELPAQARRGATSGDPGHGGAGLSLTSPAEPAAEVTLTDPLDPASTLVRVGFLVRTEGALDENSLDALLVVRVPDPFGLESGKPPLRPGHPVTGLVRGRVLTNVVVLPRAAVRELDRVNFVHREELTLTSRRITPLWSDEEHILVPADAVPADHLVATTQLVYAPEGAKVEIIPETPAAGASPTNAVPVGTNHPVAARRTP